MSFAQGESFLATRVSFSSGKALKETVRNLINRLYLLYIYLPCVSQIFPLCDSLLRRKTYGLNSVKYQFSEAVQKSLYSKSLSKVVLLMARDVDFGRKASTNVLSLKEETLFNILKNVYQSSILNRKQSQIVTFKELKVKHFATKVYAFLFLTRYTCLVSQASLIYPPFIFSPLKVSPCET